MTTKRRWVEPTVVTRTPSAEITLRQWLLLLAAVLLGQAIHRNNGALEPTAMLLVGLSILIVGLVVGLPKQIKGGLPVSINFVYVLIATQLVFLYVDPPGIYMRGEVGLDLYNVGFAVSVLGAGTLPWAKPTPSNVPIGLLLCGWGLLATWLIQVSPTPSIDVWYFQQNGTFELLHGRDPYVMRTLSIYGPGGDSFFYGHGMSENGVLQFGFPYPPLSLLMAVPGALLGDVRISHALAIGGAGAFIALGPWRGMTRCSLAAAAVFLLQPRGLFVLEQSWTEPFAILLMGLVVFRWKRGTRWGWALGLFLAVKQSLWLTAPAAVLLASIPHIRRAEILKAIATAGLVTLVLAIFHPGEFWWSTVQLHLRQPFRPDALSFMAWLAREGIDIPQVVAVGLALLALALGVQRQGATATGWATTCAFVLLVFFAFSKQAWANYYYLVIGALCLAAAADPGAELYADDRLPDSR